MGIPKLTSFVDKQFTGWKKGPVQGELIVDGFSLCHALFAEHALEHNPVYGGDYISFAIYVKNFFNTLMRCKITPFVIFDGIDIDMKKRKTHDNRRRQQAESVVKLLQAPTTCAVDNITPYLARDVMVESVREILGNNGFYVADSDADIDVASFGIAKKCPILSSDSDFYIFPLPCGYIPYSKFYWHNAESNMIIGEFYSCEQFAMQFDVSDLQLLALLPAIMGNDTIPPIDGYMERIIPPHGATLIQKVLHYASGFKTIDECKTVLLQQKLIDSYIPLQNIRIALQDYFTSTQAIHGTLKTNLRCKDGSKLPDFVVQNIRLGVYPKMIIDALCTQEVDLKVAIEDMLSEKWCHLIGIPIRKVIYGILCTSSTCVHEHQRHERSVTFDMKIITAVTSVTYHGRKIQIPNLHGCSTEIESSKKVLYGVLECREKDFKTFSKDYRLLLAITCYWYSKCIPPENNFFLYSFLLFLQKPKGVVAIKTPKQTLFSLSSFVHAFAQWQSLYYDVRCLNELLQQPLPLMEPAEFLEFSNLYGYTRAVTEAGITEVMKQLELDGTAYWAFLRATCPSGEKQTAYWEVTSPSGEKQKTTTAPSREDVRASKNRFELLSLD